MERGIERRRETGGRGERDRVKERVRVAGEEERDIQRGCRGKREKKAGQYRESPGGRKRERRGAGEKERTEERESKIERRAEERVTK